MSNAWCLATAFCSTVSLLSVAFLLLWDAGWLKVDPADPWGWMKSMEFTSQMAHVGWSCWIVLFASHWFGVSWPIIWIAFWAVLKEFVFDMMPKPYGEGATWFGGFIDFLFYGVGTGLGVSLAYLERMC